MKNLLPKQVSNALTPEEIEEMYFEAKEEVEKIWISLAAKKLVKKA